MRILSIKHCPYVPFSPLSPPMPGRPSTPESPGGPTTVMPRGPTSPFWPCRPGRPESPGRPSKPSFPTITRYYSIEAITRYYSIEGVWPSIFLLALFQGRPFTDITIVTRVHQNKLNSGHINFKNGQINATNDLPEGKIKIPNIFSLYI